MEMHQLRYMIAVARTGSFCRAAEQCHVTQPSLSQQIQGRVYRSLHPIPRRVINAVWPKQRPLSRTALEFLKVFEGGRAR